QRGQKSGGAEFPVSLADLYQGFNTGNIIEHDSAAAIDLGVHQSRQQSLTLQVYALMEILWQFINSAKAENPFVLNYQRLILDPFVAGKNTSIEQRCFHRRIPLGLKSFRHLAQMRWLIGIVAPRQSETVGHAIKTLHRKKWCQGGMHSAHHWQDILLTQLFSGQQKFGTACAKVCHQFTHTLPSPVILTEHQYRKTFFHQRHGAMFYFGGTKGFGMQAAGFFQLE